jgi:hypothetical protein
MQNPILQLGPAQWKRGLFTRWQGLHSTVLLSCLLPYSKFEYGSTNDKSIEVSVGDMPQ